MPTALPDNYIYPLADPQTEPGNCLLGFAWESYRFNPAIEFIH